MSEYNKHNEHEVDPSIKEAMQRSSQPGVFWKSFLGATVATLLVLGVVFLGLYGYKGSLFATSSEPVEVVQESKETPTQEELGDIKQAQEAASDFETAILGAVERSKEAVVSVSNYQRLLPGYPYIYGESFGPAIEEQSELAVAGEGSGVVYKIEGDKAYIVTNHHVVEGSEELKVIMYDGTVADAELIGADVWSDLAVMTIDAKYATKAIDFYDSDELKVGNIALAIGSPLGNEFQNSVTQGIVSGLERSVPIDIDGDGIPDWDASVIQTDAAINRGNSGGALVNKNGELIGINSIKFAAEGVEGMGFAIPSNEVKRIIEELEANGEVIRPVLGAQTLDLALIAEESKQEVLGITNDQQDGVVIIEIQSGTTADQSELERYDVITKMDGEEIHTINDLRKVLYSHNVGDKVSLTVLRQGEEKTIEVMLQSLETQELELRHE
ncbi:hypothetical protein CJ205_03670 [Dolosicoccus paucivorans]|uniref:PDZ domain-containing protein n=1 Tax=Dolosicoccus paucivorans TaxID=84521 RepID=A0A2N6SN93_9LACT|nr:trypsin-like peptidase domain-containing protein [Dolosicoccus paucivorans]PMB84827.1 hypothetical protein CJ206_02100 [Dolosicoccus paucivorans]PMC58531.1 hypothetical protein CJ205_03670 [Dolosicoccus paucivorans]